MISTTVIIIGGGATGSGVLRDLSMRGIPAIMLEQAVEEGLDYSPELVYDRHERSQKRDKHEIGMHSIRGGTIVGEHEIIFAGNDEIVKISHTALSKNVFAVGAVNAAVFMKDKKSGMYNMSDVIKAQ